MYLIRVSRHIYVSHIAPDQRDASFRSDRRHPDIRRWPFHMTVLLIVAISMFLWSLIVIAGHLFL